VRLTPFRIGVSPTETCRSVIFRVADMRQGFKNGWEG
jgi:hypothetical protein